MPKFHNYKNNFDYEDDCISPNDSFLSLFGKNIDINKFHEIAKTPKYKKLNEKYTEIFQIGEKRGLYTGEIQILIDLYSNGLSLHEIEYDKLDDLKNFVAIHADNLLSFVNPEMHAFLLRTNYFKKNPKDITKPHRLNRISSVIKSIMQKTDSKEKLNKFSEILSRL